MPKILRMEASSPFFCFLGCWLLTAFFVLRLALGLFGLCRLVLLAFGTAGIALFAAFGDFGLYAGDRGQCFRAGLRVGFAAWFFRLARLAWFTWLTLLAWLFFAALAWLGAFLFGLWRWLAATA